jgi:hypothetical protein
MSETCEKDLADNSPPPRQKRIPLPREFYTESELDDIGFYSRSHRRRLRQQGVLPWPIKMGGPLSKGLSDKAIIDAIRARAAKPEAAGA